MVTPNTFEATTITPMTVVGEAGITMILRFGLLFLGWSVKVPFPGLAPVDSGSVLIVVSSLSNKFIKEQMVVGVVPAAPADVFSAKLTFFFHFLQFFHFHSTFETIN